MNKTIAIVFCVESGFLEQQAKLFVESYFKFASNDNIQLIAVSPRKDHLPSHNLKQFFSDHNVCHLKDNLNTQYLHYPIANKVLACEFIEQSFTEFNSILFVDTDTVFLNPITNKLIRSIDKLYLRPVDNKGPGTIGKSDKNDLYWRKTFNLFEIDLPVANLTTTVRPNIIRPYYNAGFIWANGLPEFFQQWRNDFDRIVSSGLRPFGYQSKDNTDFRCLDQVALAVTAQRYKNNIEVLPQTYNYPLPFRPILKDRPKHPKFDELIHIHYHKWFQHPGFLKHLTNGEEKKSEQYLWLNQHLPLTPTIGIDFKC